MSVNILITKPRGEVFDTFFSDKALMRLESIGNVRYNELGRDFTPSELCEALTDIDICMSGWGTPMLDEAVLKNAGRLRMLAHTGGSVKPYISSKLYEMGVCVVSGNNVFAQSVAEGVIAYALAALRDIPHYSSRLANGDWPQSFQNKGLIGKSVGLVGYGMIAQDVVEMLKAFNCEISVFSRHIQKEELLKHNMKQLSLKELFAQCEIVSIHTGLTAENEHLITGELIRSMQKGALLINTARGGIIDEKAMCEALKVREDLTAVLDVFEHEPLTKGHELTKLNNVLLMPHMGGPTTDMRAIVTKSVTDDIQRFLKGESLICEITQQYAMKMSSN